ncbi:MAG: AI-2E family transporter [Peptococcaceae bacterium]|nr:AI-2E family transporter [Peptococcaceae bacterium]
MKRSQIRWIFIALLVLLSGFFLFSVKDIISPFVVGVVLAYLLSPLVTSLEKKGLSRRSSVAVIFIWITVLFTLLMFLLLPKLYTELGKLAVVLPERFQVIYDYGQNAKEYYGQTGLPGEVSKLIDDKLVQGQSFLINWLKNVVEDLPGLLSYIGLMILSPILAIYFLLDWKKITEGVIQLVPGKMRGEWYRLLQEVDFIIQRYIQGNIIDAALVGFIIGFGVKLIGMEYALLIGVICGITNLIPYFGPILGGIPSVLLALSKSPMMAMKVALVIFIVQQIDGNIINPRLMSNKVGLHPLWVVFALLAGGELDGIMGMLVAIPLAAILKIIFREIYYYLVSPKVLKSSKE